MVNSDGDVTILTTIPAVDELGETLDVLRTWQRAGAPIQLHPGDIGWFWRESAEATASGIRIWRRDGRIVAIGLLDEPELLRVAVAPEALADADLTRHLCVDVTEPERGVLPPGEVFVEASTSALLHDQLGAMGWVADEPWALLRRDLSTPVDDPEVRVEIIGADRAEVWCEVHRSAFGGSLELAEMTRRWTAKTTGLPFADARALAAFDDQNAAVAVAIVWSAGPGRYGLLEPMGTHPNHRGQGYGRAVTLAAARALQEMGSCAAVVPVLGSNLGAIATYTAAGFEHVGERTDRRRDA